MMTAEERCDAAGRGDAGHAVGSDGPTSAEPRREPAPPTALGGFFGAAAGTGVGVVAFGATQNPAWMTAGVALGIGLGVLAGAIRERNGS